MGALREVLAHRGVLPDDDVRAAICSDLRRLARTDRRVRLEHDRAVVGAASWAWFDRRRPGVYLAMNRFEGPVPESAVEADRAHFAPGSVWGRVFELYHDPRSLDEHARDVYREAGDHVRWGPAPFHAHVFGHDLATVDADPDAAAGFWWVTHPEALADLHALFVRSWAVSAPLLDREAASDVLVLLRLLAEARPDEEAAAVLGVAPFTYRRRLADLQAALGAPTRFAAGARAHRLGLLRLAEVVA